MTVGSFAEESSLMWWLNWGIIVWEGVFHGRGFSEKALYMVTYAGLCSYIVWWSQASKSTRAVAMRSLRTYPLKPSPCQSRVPRDQPGLQAWGSGVHLWMGEAGIRLQWVWGQQSQKPLLTHLLPLLSMQMGLSKSHPEIPRTLSFKARAFILSCFEPNPSRRVTAADLLKEDFLKQTNKGRKRRTAFSPSGEA